MFKTKAALLAGMLGAGLLTGTGSAEASAKCVASTDKPAIRPDGATIDAAFSYTCPVVPRSVTLKGVLYGQDATKKHSEWITLRAANGGANPQTKTWFSEKRPAAMHATGLLKVGKWRYILVIFGSMVGPDGKTVTLNGWLVPGLDDMGAGWSQPKTYTFHG